MARFVGADTWRFLVLLMVAIALALIGTLSHCWRWSWVSAKAGERVSPFEGLAGPPGRRPR